MRAAPSRRSIYNRRVEPGDLEMRPPPLPFSLSLSLSLSLLVAAARSTAHATRISFWYTVDESNYRIFFVTSRQNKTSHLK